MMLLAIDPGKDKIGVALYDEQRGMVRELGIISANGFGEWLTALMGQHPLECFIIGNGTHSRRIQAHLHTLAPHCPIVVVDEAYSTLEAREVYFQLYPPRGFKRWIPRSMQSPARPIDDLVALILLKRHLGIMPAIGT